MLATSSDSRDRESGASPETGCGPEPPRRTRARRQTVEETRHERFERLFHRYFRKIYSFFVRSGLSENDAEDLTQTVLLRVYESMDTYRGGDELAYLMSITRSVWKNELRRRSAKKRSASLLTLDDPDRPIDDTQETRLHGPAPRSPEEGALWQEKVRALRRKVEDLPPRNRRALLLRTDGLSYREIADATHTTVDGVKALLREARKRVRDDS